MDQDDFIAAKLVKQRCSLCSFQSSATVKDTMILLLACHCLHIHGVDAAREVLSSHFSPAIAALILVRETD